MVLPPAGPPPPSLPEGWKAHWNAEYKAWFYENIYTEESVWEKPTEAVYPPPARAPLPPGPPPGYQAMQQASAPETNGGTKSSLNTMNSVSLSDGNQSGPPPQQQQQPYSPPPNNVTPQPTPPSLYSSPPQAAPGPPPTIPTPMVTPDGSRDYNAQAPQYPVQPGYPGYPPQQAPSPGYAPQPQYSPQPNYTQQPQYAQGPPPPQPAPAPKAGGFMGMLQSKVGNKVPGGAGTVLGIGGGLLAGAVMEHEWDKHEDRERRRHHHGGFGGLGGLMRGFGGDGGQPVVENITINEDVNYNSDAYISF